MAFQVSLLKIRMYLSRNHGVTAPKDWSTLSYPAYKSWALGGDDLENTRGMMQR